MTVRLEDGVIRLEGICRVEEAEQLTALLQVGPKPVDLSQCRQTHGAVVQALLAFAPPICAQPLDTALREILQSVLGGRQD